MKTAIIEYGKNTKQGRRVPRSVNTRRYYSHLKSIKNDILIEGSSVSDCLIKAVDMVANPDKLNIKIINIDRAV